MSTPSTTRISKYLLRARPGIVLPHRSMSAKSTPATPQSVYSRANGFPYERHPYGSQVARKDGPILLQDTHLIENLSHFDRQRTPDRIVHAAGGGCRFEFKLTESLSDITYAAPYQEVGYTCPGVVRFSTVGGEIGSSQTVRDPRGVSMKFYTKWGNHDWVFNNTPIFFIRDALKFPHFIHTQKRYTQNFLNASDDSSMFWDYLTQNVESIHQVTYLFGNRGTPKDWAQMNSYSGHTFKFVTKEGKITFVQIHVKPKKGGFQVFKADEANHLAGARPNYNQAILFDRLENQKPEDAVVWECFVQTMTPKQAAEFKYSVNDLTKIWPHKEYPLRKFGEITLTENVDNYWEEIEQIAFSPANTTIPGIEPSNDNVLQSRLFSYPDTQRHRLGPNYEQLPVNRPRNLMCPYSKTGFVPPPPAANKEKYTSEMCPFRASNYQRDGYSNLANFGKEPNYISTLPEATIKYKDPNTDELTSRFQGVVLKETEDAALQEQLHEQAQLEDIINDKLNNYYYVSGVAAEDLEQPRNLYEKVFSAEEKADFVANVCANAQTAKHEYIKIRVAQYFGLLNQDLGAAIAKGLNVEWKPVTLEQYAEAVNKSAAF